MYYFALHISCDENNLNHGKGGDIAVVNVLIHCALLHSVCDLKAEHMNMKCMEIYAL